MGLSAADIIDYGTECCGYDIFGKLPLGKILNAMEVTAWERTSHHGRRKYFPVNAFTKFGESQL